jgi:hypothetical protein
MRGRLKAAGGCVVAVLAIAYAIAFFAPAVGTFHDDGVYLVTSACRKKPRKPSIHRCFRWHWRQCGSSIRIFPPTCRG